MGTADYNFTALTKRPTATNYGVVGTVNDPFGTSASDIVNANREGWKDAGIASGIGAAATGAQLALTMIDTPQDEKNKKRLAELKVDKGLTQGRRAEIDEQAMRGVRGFAAEGQARTDDALAASGQTSAAALSQTRRDTARSLNEASIRAADIGIREDAAQVIRDTDEENQRLAYESNRQKERIGMIGQAISGLAQQFGQVYAANPAQRAPSASEIDYMRGLRTGDDRPVYPGLQDITNEAAIANYDKALREARAAR